MMTHQELCRELDFVKRRIVVTKMDGTATMICAKCIVDRKEDIISIYTGTDEYYFNLKHLVSIEVHEIEEDDE